MGPVALVVAAAAALGAGGAGPAFPAEVVAFRVALAATPAQQAQAVYDQMTQAQRIGQLFMVGTSVNSLDAATRRQ